MASDSAYPLSIRNEERAPMSHEAHEGQPDSNQRRPGRRPVVTRIALARTSFSGGVDADGHVSSE